jgi:hypothetical protein
MRTRTREETELLKNNLLDIIGMAITAVAAQREQMLDCSGKG